MGGRPLWLKAINSAFWHQTLGSARQLGAQIKKSKKASSPGNRVKMAGSFLHCLLSGSESNLHPPPPPAWMKCEGTNNVPEERKGRRGMNSLEYLLSGGAATKAEPRRSHESRCRLRRLFVSAGLPLQPLDNTTYNRFHGPFSVKLYRQVTCSGLFYLAGWRRAARGAAVQL